MALQYSATLVNAKLDSIETTLGTFPHLKIRTGPAPATVATADSGTVLANVGLPSDWMGAASAGVKSLIGTWIDTSADASGTAQHFRLYTNAQVAHCQGTANVTGFSPDMVLDSNNFTAGQSFNITAFAITSGNFP